ncbi:Protein-disulfide isomerase [Roseivivax lentus]|uniref:Protein-disulfide isomerase n=1 Tax=Roseivivax lentus TaxID=633194 RepID=A0A1N7MDG0_9RHOB|nr:DsbA family protein [Roseivivax lentus]SIS84126.1 Protein-disulfide isomerase [Roseivivax lentus]
MKRMISATALAAVLGLGGWFALQNNGVTTSTDATADLTLPGAANAQSAAASDGGSAPAVMEMALGAEDAPVEVIEYASYTCPHCASFHANVFDEIKKNYVDTGKVRFVYREVYFDKYGMWASLVARCGGNQDRFFGITDMIYQSQSDWARAGSDAAIAEGLRKIGRLAGLGNDELEACLTDGDKLRALVEWYQANAEQDEVRSTPSFVIEGELYSNMNYGDFAEILDAKLADQ